MYLYLKKWVMKRQSKIVYYLCMHIEWIPTAQTHTQCLEEFCKWLWHKETFNSSKLKMAYLKKCLFTFWDSGSVLMQQEEGCLLNQQQNFLCTETRGSTWGSSLLVLTFCSAFVRNEVTVSRASWHSCVCISDCSSKNICRCFWERMCFSFQCESPYQCVSMWGVSGDCLAGELYRKNLHHSLLRREIYDRWVRYKYLNSTSLNG